MAKKNGNMRTCLKHVKFILLLSLFLIHFPSKRKENCMEIKNCTGYNFVNYDNTRKESSRNKPHAKTPLSPSNERQKWNWAT